ncbi:TlpA family protein disulfide reductase [Tenacibaculum finnmarkense]|uniref:TlpA family protein disulfide reductase n=1 Tax=Tenacibaculum finnmarkense TaxID=2781243 RepID=UPI001EFC25CC|nr:TlpA disulfide reductase family protein [Tenacibaculum finnmarkense]MCG8235424.1 TlpA family protein disulfide reductase [Tenacibaculum finnmarkense genomovar ulcerans]MCG8795096.1 TlpA family protein disulfide reductase [Tenacibaculum finnmarkense]MCG8797423.1 TlpA family protein disulfide reductase [Tenacibaculum finnmarkense]MCG8829555.1 TlpA family protein disulfide reductase [Tenacibaculum finnmarkense]
MKKILLLALIGVSIISCKEEKPKPVKDYLVLSGKIENFKKRDVTLNGFNFNKKIKFNKKTGTFLDTLKISKEGYYTLIANKKPIKLYLSDTVNTKIIFDYKNNASIKFEGGNANINNYFVQKGKKFSEILINANNLFSLEEGDFLEKMNQYKEALITLSISNNLPTNFLKKEVKNINYEYLRNLSNYQDFYATLTENEEFAVSKDFPNPLNGFNYSSDEDYVNSYAYRKMLETQLDLLAKEKNEEGKCYYLTYLETTHAEVNSSIAKNDLLYKNAKNGITFTPHLKEFHDKFIAYSTNEKHKKEISKTYNILKTTAKGQPAPKFSNFENYNGGTTSLDDLLNKGNYLYIDVWATWCAYCKREIPLLKNLEEEYHGKKLTFVSISVDDKKQHEKWKQTIIDREMTGIQLFSGKKQNDLEWAQKFLIKGLPKFIIIAPDGTIVSPNAPAPSQGEKLTNIFDELGI